MNNNKQQTKIIGHIIDIENRTITDGTLVIADGKISSIEPLEAASSNSSLPYILPGFVDAHIHIESTLLLPSQFAALAVARGVTTVVADPHEIANVLGREGVEYMVREGQKANFHFHFGIPSCVPSTPFETSGAQLNASEVEQMMGQEQYYGLAEMMNYPGVLSGDSETLRKIASAIAHGKPVDGHAPGLAGDKAEQYIAAGITTDHECTSLDEASERIALGMKVLIREGSAACDFDNLCPLLSMHDSMVMLCSDDKYPDELQQGYIDQMVRRAIAKGMPLWNVLQAACITPLDHYNLPHGRLHIGDNADFICVDNFNKLNILSTFINGKEVYNHRSGVNELLHEHQHQHTDTPTPNKFRKTPIAQAQIAIPALANNIKVILAEEGKLYTHSLTTEAKIVNNQAVSDPERDVLKLVVCNRYAEEPPAVAFIRGFKLHTGAIASTIAHDSHNIIAVGCDDEALTMVINKLIEVQGGLCAYNGEQLHLLPLPVAGLMASADGETVAKQHLAIKQTVHQMGCPFAAPFMTLAFMALPVIPELKLTDKGLFDSLRFEFTELFSTSPCPY